MAERRPETLIADRFDLGAFAVGFVHVEPPLPSLSVLWSPDGSIVAANRFQSTGDFKRFQLSQALAALLTGLPDDDDALAWAKGLEQAHDHEPLAERLDNREILTLLDRVGLAFGLTQP